MKDLFKQGAFLSLFSTDYLVYVNTSEKRKEITAGKLTFMRRAQKDKGLFEPYLQADYQHYDDLVQIDAEIEGLNWESEYPERWFEAITVSNKFNEGSAYILNYFKDK